MNRHVVQTYDREQAALDGYVAQMGGLVEGQLWQSFQALDRRNPQLAARAVFDDVAVDRLDRHLQELAIRLIGKRQPVAEDLRHAVAVLKISGDLERIGDLSKSIARRAMTIAHAEHRRAILIGLGHMTEVAARQLKNVLDAWSARDAEKALGVWNGDHALDALYNSVFGDLLVCMMEDPRNIEYCMHLLFVAKNLERIGDHTTNIAAQVRYAVVGIKHVDARLKAEEASTSSQNGPVV